MSLEMCDEELRRHGRHLHDRHHVAEGDREADHDHHHADRAHDASDQLRQIAPFAVAIDEHRHQKRVDAGDRGGFSRREDAGEDPAEDDHDRDHSPNRVERDLERLTQWHDLALRKLVAMRDDQHQHDQRQAQQQRRNDARHEQVGDRDRAAGGDANR